MQGSGYNKKNDHQDTERMVCMPQKLHTDKRKAKPTVPPKHGNEPQDLQIQAQQAMAKEDWKTSAYFYARAAEQYAAELSLINSVQEGLSSKFVMQDIYDLVGDKLRDTFNAQVVMISQYDPNTKMIFHHYAIERGKHLHIPGWQSIDSSRANVVRTRKPYMINAAEIIRVLEAQMMHVVPGTEVPKTWLGVPMLVGGEARGIVSLQNLDDENAFSRSDINLLSTLTNAMSQSLENARLLSETQRLLNLLEGEMEIARQTQQSILPKQLPRFSGYDFGSLIIPARTVCGDFYDFIPLDERRLAIVIGDVTDKGLSAALFMALTFSLVQVETGLATDSYQVLHNVNRHLHEMDLSGIFVTLLYCVLDCDTGIIQYSRAGHLPPIILDKDGSFIDIPVNLGQPLGVFEDVQIDHQQLTLPQGGMMLLYSDGLNEAADPQGREFGFQQVKQELLNNRHHTAGIICQKLWQAVQSHSGEIQNQDDFTTVVIKRGES
jgi:serine phosphatase RsbU (regulator of sigma subunit)